MTIFRALFIAFALLCVGLGVNYIVDEQALAEGRVTEATIQSLILEGHPEMIARRGRSTRIESDGYARVEFRHEGTRQRAKVFLPDGLYDTLAPGDTLPIVYVPAEPSLARTTLQQRDMTPGRVWGNVYFVMAGMSLLVVLMVTYGNVIPTSEKPDQT